MIKRFISFNFTLITTILIVVGFVTLYFRFRILDPQVHINAFEQVDSSERISGIIDENLENYLKEELVVDEENNFPPKLTARIIRTILLNIDFSTVISETWSQNVVHITNWMKGDAEFSLFFPKELIIENYESAGSDDNFVSDLIDISGYSELPVCKELSDISQADYLNGTVKCGGPFLKEFVKNDFINRVGDVNGQTFLEGFLNQVLRDVNEQTTLSGESLQKFNNSEISQLPSILNNVKIYSISGLLIAIVTGILAVKFSNKPALAFLKIIANFGILIVLMSLLSKVAVRIIADFLLWGNIKFSSEIYNDVNVKLIMDYLKDLTGAILDKILVEFMIIGISTIIFVVILYIIFKVARIITPDSNPDEEDEYYEDEENDSEEDDITDRESAEISDNKDFEKQILLQNSNNH